MIQPKSETDLILSITNFCETLSYQTQTRPQETVDFVLRQPIRTIFF